MKAGWTEKPISQCFKVKSGDFLPAKAMATDGNIYVYGGNGITGKHNAKNLSGENIIIGRVGAYCGNVRHVSGDAWVTDNAFYISEYFASFDYGYLATLLEYKQLRNTANQAAQPVVSYTTIKDVLLQYPPLPEQQRIVNILDEAFDCIATAKANAEKNLQNARALFDCHLQSVFTHGGNGWKRTIVGDQMTLQRGFDITKKEQNEGDVPVVSSGGIKSFHDKAMAQAPGVVIGRKGTLGKVFYLETDFWPHDTTLWIKDFKGNNPRFVYYFFTGLDVKHLDSGTANPALNRNLVHPIEVNWPPVTKQGAIVETLDALSDETQRLESIYQQKFAALDALKKSLLDQAFTGQL